MDEIFDAISYSKGASVIRMLHNYIGDEVRGHVQPAAERHSQCKSVRQMVDVGSPGVCCAGVNDILAFVIFTENFC